jgi:hypothetical protein
MYLWKCLNRRAIDEREDGRAQTDHWVCDAGKASMYGFTMRSYNAGVSRTMWTCCLEYHTKNNNKKGGGIVKDSGSGCNSWNDVE